MRNYFKIIPSSQRNFMYKILFYGRNNGMVIFEIFGKRIDHLGNESEQMFCVSKTEFLGK